MCDGSYQYPRKGEEAIKKDMLIIICGNQDPKLVYPNQFDKIEVRFNIINL